MFCSCIEVPESMPRCDAPMRCIKPNCWNTYMKIIGDSGSTREEMVEGYRDWKTKWIEDNAGLGRSAAAVKMNVDVKKIKVTKKTAKPAKTKKTSKATTAAKAKAIAQKGKGKEKAKTANKTNKTKETSQAALNRLF